MKTDHTKAVEKRLETIEVNLLDGCSFYAPKEGSLIVVNFCAYCRFSEFNEKSKNGYCNYYLENNRGIFYED